MSILAHSARGRKNVRHKINSAFLEKHSAVKVGKTGAMFARLRAGSQGSPPGKVPSLLPRCITFVLHHTYDNLTLTLIFKMQTRSKGKSDAKVIHSGVLEKRGKLNTAFKKRWCALKDDGRLYYYKLGDRELARASILLEQVEVRVRVSLLPPLYKSHSDHNPHTFRSCSFH